jgi:hypothetical protein
MVRRQEPLGELALLFDGRFGRDLDIPNKAELLEYSYVRRSRIIFLPRRPYFSASWKHVVFVVPTVT